MDTKKRDVSINPQHPVVMSNQLIEARCTLKTNELKLLRLAFMQVLKSDTDFMTYTFKATELADTLGIARENMYRDINQMMWHIAQPFNMGEVFEGEGSKGAIAHWGKFTYENGRITFKLDDFLKPYLLELKGNFTRYELGEILKLKSVYSIRLYELILAELKSSLNYQDTKQVYLSLESIQKATNTDGKYSQVGMFIKRVIEPAVEEINSKSESCGLSYSPVKKGKKIIGFNFTATTALVKVMGEMSEASKQRADEIIERMKREEQELNNNI